MGNAAVMNCQVCFESYDRATRIPLVYACGHTYCLVCVEGYHRNGEYKCPTCRQTQHNTPAKNFTMFEFIDNELLKQMNNLINEKEAQTLQLNEAVSSVAKLTGEKEALEKDLKNEKNERMWADEGREIETHRKHGVMEQRDAARTLNAKLLAEIRNLERDMEHHNTKYVEEIDKRYEVEKMYYDATQEIKHLESMLKEGTTQDAVQWERDARKRVQEELKDLKFKRDRMEYWLHSIAGNEYYQLIDGEYVKQDLERQYRVAYGHVHNSSGQKVYPRCEEVRKDHWENSITLNGVTMPIINKQMDINENKIKGKFTYVVT